MTQRSEVKHTVNWTVISVVFLLVVGGLAVLWIQQQAPPSPLPSASLPELQPSETQTVPVEDTRAPVTAEPKPDSLLNEEQEAVPSPVQSADTVQSKTIAQELLESAPATYWFAVDDDGALVSGTKRSTGIYEPHKIYEYFFALMFWDTVDGVVYMQAGRPISETWWQREILDNEDYRSKGLSAELYHPAFFQLNLTGDRAKDKTLIPKELNRYYFSAKENELDKLFDSYYLKSPVDWLRTYANETPIKVDTTSLIQPFFQAQARSNLSLTFKSKEQDEQIVFIIHPTWQLPLIVERHKDNVLIERIKYAFDTTYTHEGKLRVAVTPEVTSLPENYVVVTPDQYQKFLDDVETRY